MTWGRECGDNVREKREKKEGKKKKRKEKAVVCCKDNAHLVLLLRI